MPLSPAREAAYRLRRTHELLQAAVDAVDDAALYKSGGVTAPSVAFHLWHVARYADRLQARLHVMTDEMGRRLGEEQQIWDTESVADTWGLPSEQLGGAQSGMGMDEEVSLTMRLPARETLFGYALRAFEAANRAADAVDDDQFGASSIDLYGRDSSVAAALLHHLAHANRHLGMIEALKGVRGLKGTATT